MLAPQSLPASASDLDAVTRLMPAVQMSATSQEPNKPRRVRYAWGQQPNVHWRAVSVEELREHPRMLSLPECSELRMAGPATFRYVRQDESLWSELHEGVLTSRHLLAVLGFREPQAAERLRLPRGFVSPGALEHAYAYFREASPDGAVWAGPGCSLSWAPPPAVAEATRANDALRILPVKGRWPPRSIPPPLARPSGSPSISRVRCSWGSAQEASTVASLLHALPDALVEEVGLAMVDPSALPSGIPEHARRLATQGLLPPMGASPDGLLRRTKDKKLEVLEVKNTCPFFVRRSRPWRKRRPADGGGKAGGGSGSDSSEESAQTFSVLLDYLDEEEAKERRVPMYERRGPHGHVAPQFVPQLQWEMLAAGTSSGTLASCSSHQGLNLFSSERDDAYLGELLHYIGLFWGCVLNGTPPTPELYWSEPERYTAFLDQTVRVGEAASLYKHVPRPWRRQASGTHARLFHDYPR